MLYTISKLPVFGVQQKIRKSHQNWDLGFSISDSGFWTLDFRLSLDSSEDISKSRRLGSSHVFTDNILKTPKIRHNKHDFSTASKTAKDSWESWSNVLTAMCQVGYQWRWHSVAGRVCCCHAAMRRLVFALEWGNCETFHAKIFKRLCIFLYVLNSFDWFLQVLFM